MPTLNESTKLTNDELGVYNEIDNYLQSVNYYGISCSADDQLNHSRAFTCWYIMKKWHHIFKGDYKRALNYVVDGPNDNKIDAVLNLVEVGTNKPRLYLIQAKYYTYKLELEELRNIKELLSNINDIDKNDDNFKSPNEDLRAHQRVIKNYLKSKDCEIHIILLTTSLLSPAQADRWNAFKNGVDLYSLPKTNQNYDDDPITGEVKDLLTQLRKNHQSVSLDLVDLNELKRLGYVTIK